jgi:hypothetical protein
MSDVFISYSHVDNEKGYGQDQGWIDWFYKVFDTKLRQLCGSQIEVWRDHKIDGSDVLTPTIDERVRKARLLVSVMSPSYLKSEWCSAELRLFVAAAQADGCGLQVGTKSRILKVLKTPVERSSEAKAAVDTSDIIGYPFFRTQENGRPWEYDPALGQAEREEFFREVYEVALDARALLSAMLGNPDGTALVKPSGITIFVADSGADLAGDVERLRRELRQFGHVVLPQASNGYGPEYEPRVREDLARADIVINPISKTLGPMPELSDQRIVALQYALTQEEVGKRPDCMRLAWMPTGAKPAELPDPSLAKALEFDPSLRICSLEDVKSMIATLVDGFRERGAPSSEPRQASGEERLAIYLICDEVDRDRAKPLADRLYQSGYAVTLPLFEGDESDRRDDHEENLKACDAVLVLHASSTDFWRRKMLRDVKRAFGNGRRRPFLARGLLLTEAGRASAADILDPDLVVMTTSDNFSAGMLDPFLAAIARPKGQAV